MSKVKHIDTDTLNRIEMLEKAIKHSKKVTFAFISLITIGAIGLTVMWRWVLIYFFKIDSVFGAITILALLVMTFYQYGKVEGETTHFLKTTEQQKMMIFNYPK
jgi:hypothetical protein